MRWPRSSISRCAGRFRPGAGASKASSVPLITISDLHKRFGSLEVLKGIDLDIEAGEVIAIIGRSGSGKSTLLRCVNGLETYEGGRITVDDTPGTREEKDLRQLRL